MSYLATSAIDQVLEAVIDTLNTAKPFATITRGALPTGAGITCEIAPSSPLAVHMDKNSVIALDVTLNGKHHDLKTLSDTMNNLHSLITRAKTYTSGTSWQIIDVENYTLPQVIGREQNNDWLMASSLNVKFYWKGD